MSEFKQIMHLLISALLTEILLDEADSKITEKEQLIKDRWQKLASWTGWVEQTLIGVHCQHSEKLHSKLSVA